MAEQNKQIDLWYLGLISDSDLPISIDTKIIAIISSCITNKIHVKYLKTIIYI